MEGSFTIQRPPTPSVGIVNPPPLPAFLSAEKLELYAGQGKLEPAGIALFGERLLKSRWQCFAFGGTDRDGTGQILSQHPQQEEFALGVHVRPFRQIVAQRTFRQEVRQERRHRYPCFRQASDQAAKLVLERKAQGWPVLIGDVVVGERKQGTQPLHHCQCADMAPGGDIGVDLVVPGLSPSRLPLSQ